MQISSNDGIRVKVAVKREEAKAVSFELCQKWKDLPTSEKLSLVQGAVRLAMLCEFLSIPFGFLAWRLKIPVQVTK